MLSDKKILNIMSKLVFDGYPAVNVYNVCRRRLKLSDEKTSQLMDSLSLFSDKYNFSL